MENGASKYEWRHAPEARWGFWEILKMSVSRVETRHRTRRVDFRLLAEALGWCRTRYGGADEKARIERLCLSLSPYVEKPLNSKVIKSFVPELRSRKCFSCFEIPMFYVHICEHPIYISHIHVYGNGTSRMTDLDFTSEHFPGCEI